MQPGPTSLRMPSFLHGSFATVARRSSTEGRRCGEHYRQHSTFPPPRELREAAPGEVVIAHEVVDFQREQPAWRLYQVSRVLSGLYEAMEFQSTSQVRDAYEALCRETAWGALYFAIAPPSPVSAERTALRLQAVLRFWEPLQSARYLFTSPNAVLTLEDLMMASQGWAVEAWCPPGEAPIRDRLTLTAERLARATPQDSIEAILRQLPRALTEARALKHRDMLSSPSFQRQRLAMLSPEAFARVSGACTGYLIELLYDWDDQASAH